MQPEDQREKDDERETVENHSRLPSVKRFKVAVHWRVNYEFLK